MKLYFVVKRVFDIIASVLGIVITSPFWILAVIGIEISDPGPVFYKANRIGKGNKPFKMYKFRSMLIDNNADEKSFKADANRIFKFGKFIRDFKIDELPQLLNILNGTMSVVGPRPAAEDQVGITRGGKYSKASDVKPGLTGPGALYDYIYGDTVDDEDEYIEKVLPTRLELEICYIDKMGIFYDINMIWYTVLCILHSVIKKEPVKIVNELYKQANISDVKENVEEVTMGE